MAEPAKNLEEFEKDYRVAIDIVMAEILKGVVKFKESATAAAKNPKQIPIESVAVTLPLPLPVAEAITELREYGAKGSVKEGMEKALSGALAELIARGVSSIMKDEERLDSLRKRIGGVEDV